MLIDFAEVHRTYLIGRMEGGAWVFTPTNATSPGVGFFPSSHQVFSNNGLQIAIYLYNSIKGNSVTGVSHCLYLNFSHRSNGRYLLANDPERVALNLDIGVAADLYALAQGHVNQFNHSVIRSGKSPKHLYGIASIHNGSRQLTLICESAKDGRATRIEVDLNRAETIALAAHCIGYGRLLYPALSDTAILTLLSENHSESRACADLEPSYHGEEGASPSQSLAQPGHTKTRACAETASRLMGSGMPLSSRLSRAVWAIGQQKWAGMTLEALKAIQSLQDQSQIQRMIDEANGGDFRSWDAFLKG
ncbi:hypothetical protein ACI77O_13175 [Pseudomonas tritici]|uniref:hypothetical protein n=1 Tax=Pseudomonas tritici TaxID=2745518 RepID=UPI00387B91DB